MLQKKQSPANPHWNKRVHRQCYVTIINTKQLCTYLFLLEISHEI